MPGDRSPVVAARVRSTAGRCALADDVDLSARGGELNPRRLGHSQICAFADHLAAQLAPIDADTEILNRPFREGFSLENVLDEVARHYISRAQTQTGGRVTRAASLLGYEHYQVLNRKIKNLGLKNDA